MISAILLPFLLIPYSPAVAFLPTFSPENKHICEGFGFNWAAEIRCLRDIINKCDDSELLLKSRGGRSLNTSPDYSASSVTLPDYTNPPNPFAYPRPYSRTYYRHSVRPIPTPAAPRIEGDCNKCAEDIKKLEAKFEKKLYEVKMKAEYDTQKEVGDLKKFLESDMRNYERITTRDISAVKRQLDYIQAPKITNNDVEYFFINRDESWYTASEKCIGYGGHLASVHSRLENGLVSSLISVNETAWIGVNDIQKENVFKNPDLTPMDYFNWAKKQPNNEEHNENCVEVDQNGLWNDKLCIVTRPFVCKKRVIS